MYGEVVVMSFFISSTCSAIILLKFMKFLFTTRVRVYGGGLWVGTRVKM